MSTLPQDHPLRRSSWIWPEFYMYLHNHFAQFRWDFELDEVSQSVPLFLTADKAYRLYVNGTPIGRGPARGYQSHWPFDEWDIAPHLRAGANWISVEGYQPGCSTFQYLHANYAGLLMATSDASLETALATGSRAMRRSPGHRRETARYSLQIDYQEHLDLREDDRSWITSPTAPAGWRAQIFPDIAQRMLSMPFGRAPYDSVEPRGIPNLREEAVAPALPTVQATGRSSEGYTTVSNVSWHWVEEGRAVGAWEPADVLAPRIEGDELVMEIPATGAGGFRAVVVPAGEYVLGTVAVKVEGAAGGEILDFQHDQFFRDGLPHFVEPGDGSMVALGNRLILRSGDNEHEFFHALGFGHLTLIARDLESPLTVRLSVRKIGYPFTMTGTFEASDTLLNQIHAISRRAQQLCALDAYMDTPWREQAQWWGDARVQARNTFYMDGDARLLARGIRSLAGQSVSGLTPGHAPTSSYWCVLPDFALTWILTLWDHYWQTGETELFREMVPRVREVLAYFDTPEARHRTGLLQYDRRFWLFEDWSELPKEGIPTFLNLWYVVALRHLAQLAEVAGMPDASHEWQAMADAHAALVTERAFDEAQGLFMPALTDEGVPYGEPSVHDQTLALMLDLKPEAHAVMLGKRLLPYLRQEPLEGALPSAFWSAYVLEEAIKRGYAAEAIEFIRCRWEPMLATGTTWEDFKWHEESGLSACHAWAGHPSYHFVNALAGVRQSAPAWREIRFEPTFLPEIERVSATVPSPQGPVRVEWTREGSEVRGEIAMPAGVTVSSPLTLTDQGQRIYGFAAGAKS